MLDYFKNNIEKLEPSIYYYRYKLRYLMMLYILGNIDFEFELEKFKTQSKTVAVNHEINKYLAFFNVFHHADRINYKKVDEVCNSTCESYTYFHLSKMEYYKKSKNIEKLIEYSTNRISFLTQSGIDIENIYEFLYSLSYISYAKNDENVDKLLSSYKRSFEANSEIINMTEWIKEK